MLLGTCLGWEDFKGIISFVDACQLRYITVLCVCVRGHFKNIDGVIATIKNKDRKKDFHDAGLPSPLDQVVSRWATWLRAVLYHYENLPAVRIIVNNWTSAGLFAEHKTLSM